VRIVQLVESLELGGLERMALDLARSLKAEGHEVSIWCLFQRGILAAEAEASGISVEAFDKPPGFSGRTLLKLALRLRRERPDVLQTHNLGTHVYGAPAAALAGVRATVSTRHGFISSEGLPYRENRFQVTLPFTDAVVAVSGHTLEGLHAAGSAPAGKSLVIYNGIRAEPFFARPAHPGAARPRLRFGTVGRLVPAKGHAVLIEAFSQIAGEFPDTQVLVAGDGPLRSEFEQQIKRLGLGDRVSLVGTQTDVAAFLSTLDVFVFPSLNEGLPLAILEALAAGLPVVATRVGGIPEVAPEDEVAWYAAPGDAAALAAAMKTAVQSPDLCARGTAARARAESLYTLDAMRQGYVDLYQRVLAGQAPGRER
jgi:glycosyltransferase involved in cell wall biosynthesis